MSDILIIANEDAAMMINGGGGSDGLTWSQLHDDFGPMNAEATWSGSQTACTITESGDSKVKITKAGGFTNCLEGLWCYVEFSGTYVDGRYILFNKIDNDNIVIDLAWSSSVPTCDVNCGGALFDDADHGADIQAAFDLCAAGDVIKICTDVDTADVYETDTMIDVDGATGTFDKHVIIQGVNRADGVEVTRIQKRPIIRATGAIDAVLKVNDDTDYYEFRCLDIDGDSQATYAFQIADSTSTNNLIFNCRFRNAATSGVFCPGRGAAFVYCECDNNGHNGIYLTGWYNSIIGCNCHDNTGRGIYNNGPYNRIIHNVIYDNLGRGGIDSDGASDHGYYEGNIVEGNTGAGLYLANSGVTGLVVINNSFCNNGGYGVNFAGTALPGLNTYFGYNHSHGNSSGHSDEAVDNSAWADLGNGNNSYGDPKFFDIAGHDYRPGKGSDLLNNGFPDYLPIDADPLGVANFALIGALRTRIKSRVDIL